MPDNQLTSNYERYHVETRTAANIVPWPSRFRVKVKRLGLIKLLVRELIQYRGDPEVVLSRPCVYGVFSGPLGGLNPRENLCVGCLRCTTQHPEFVRIIPNIEQKLLGDSYFTSHHVNAAIYEASTGRVPVKGAGYRGKFGGEGWDGVWTDMSEIVRPTRDGIHGREFISTVVDIGGRPAFLSFNEEGQTVGEIPRTAALPLPILFDRPPESAASATLYRILSQAASDISTLAFMPLPTILTNQLHGRHLVPLLTLQDADRLADLSFHPQMVAIDVWNEDLVRKVRSRLPDAAICLRLPFTRGRELLSYADEGVSIFHLTADYHGLGPNGEFVFDLIRAAHNTFVEAGRRDEVTLLGSGGIVAAEHIPKAIIAGLDAAVLDTPLLVALQARFEGEFRNGRDQCRMPSTMTVEWGGQRLKNLTWAWRDQLLEVLGAMGLREVRRLRGEMGRALFHKDLEREAFSGIAGYGDASSPPSEEYEIPELYPEAAAAGEVAIIS